jgi:hypothetical protein
LNLVRNLNRAKVPGTVCPMNARAELVVMETKQIDHYVELLCQKGCAAVREDIRLLEQGGILPELRSLDDLARQTILNELLSIMSVYGDSCSVALSTKRETNGLDYDKKEKKTW